MPVSSILEEIREAASSERDKGDRFEVLMRTAFLTDRTYTERFSDVWLWMDWPDRPVGEPDIGIDLVAQNRDGGFTAIQCKNYAPTTPLSKEDIDSFFTASGRSPFTHRIIVATTDLWSVNAEKSLVGQLTPVTRVGVDELDAMTIDWDAVDINNLAAAPATARHELRHHQVTAVEKVRAGFGESDRGKLIMACGTGKTFTGLRIAEEHAGTGKAVLFLAPSIALVSQSLKEWTGECQVPIRPFAVCSDATAGKSVEGESATPFDLAIPPTTSVEDLITAGAGEPDTSHMTVVFSTYQSIQVVADVQAATGLVFDLVMCDEAHRTAGVSKDDSEDSAFVKVHDDQIIPARKRLYMTATPKIYKPAAKQDAREKDAHIASMDDPETFGPEFHRLGFGDAVEMGLLADYKVLILTVEESAISDTFQTLLSENGELNLPDVAKLVGCLTGLAKLHSGEEPSPFTTNPQPMQRAVAFWSNIKESEKFADQFDLVAEHYNTQRSVNDDDYLPLAVPTRHVDGTDNIRSRRSDIRWLKDETEPGECRILSNARCLTEGVDVPALDAVMFLKPRRSKIDIVQAVGRVMRKPPGKHIGYIILPVAIPPGENPATALDRNKDYEVVWSVLQALRSHDERFNAYINRIALREDSTPDPKGPIVIVDGNPADIDDDDSKSGDLTQGQLFTFEEWSEAIYTRIVTKVGTRTYWEDWAKDVAKIAARHETRINTILDNQSAASTEFDSFLTGLHAILNNSITRSDAISMLSQHLITRPIFGALFGNNDFTQHNPVSAAMQDMVDVLDQHNLKTETDTLEGFFDSVRRRVEGIPASDAHARQTIIKDLYGQFFKTAFPKVADSLGIVYTPIEVVDFIIRATQAALNEHFNGATLSDEGVHILDPFTGTGTFITRLLQSGFIKPHDLARKYANEVHANEMLLLAYYIAAINIETTYQQAIEEDDLSEGYEPFGGMVLADTFQLGETGGGTGVMDVFPVNNARAQRQKSLDIRVIIGNPPYSSGQDSVNDDNQNLTYPTLDASIGATYSARSTAVNKNSLYDSYVRAIRWASNRITGSADGGVVAFVTNGGYIDGNTAAGIRLSLADEFHHVYIYNLRGNQRTAGERSRREGGKIFDAGSRATVAVMLLVKQPHMIASQGAVIHYRDIGDYLTRDQKLALVNNALDPDDPQLDSMPWKTISPDEHGDWINQRSDTFQNHLPAHSKNEPSIFELRSNGLKTTRDAWNYNSSRSVLEANTGRMIEHYNTQLKAFQRVHPGLTGNLTQRAAVAKKSVDLDPTQFSWDREDFKQLAKGTLYNLDDAMFMTGTYRPFHRRWANAGRRLNSMIYQLPRIYPNPGTENTAIAVSTKGARSPFTTLTIKDLPELHLWIDDTPIFPMWIYEQLESDTPDGLFEAGIPVRRHNVTDHALHLYQGLDTQISKDDIFHYVYGILHSPDYRRTYAADLQRELPRVPMVETADDFWAFSKAGRDLTHLHTEYEEIEPWAELNVVYSEGFNPDGPDSYRVTKMKHPKIANPDDPVGRKINDLTHIIYNNQITIVNIPVEAYGYMLGSRSALAWIMESFRIKTDKKSGITNDPNDWSTEHDDPTYIFDLVGRIVAVSMRTLEIVESIPPLAL